MDPRVGGAGIAMAVGLLVLLPTFNALNNSYVTDVAPPDWLARLIDPDDLPEDFRPPDDYTPPEGWEPPPDLEPPPGWEPPPGYDGPIPPGGCPPPVPVWYDSLNGTRRFDTNFQSPTRFNFEVAPYTVAVVANVTFTDWQAQQVRARLVPPAGEPLEDGAAGESTGLLFAPTPVAESPFSFQIIAQDENSLPPSGRYTIEIEIDLPVSGSYELEALAVLACGGMLR